MTDQSLREALDPLRENWTMSEIVREAIQEAEWCCEFGCGSGACESCPCCTAGFCVSGRDGLPTDDPESVGAWLEIAAKHNPAIAALRPLLLAAHPAEPAPACRCDGPGPEGQHRTWCRLFDPNNDDPWDEQEPAPVGVEITDEARKIGVSHPAYRAARDAWHARWCGEDRDCTPADHCEGAPDRKALLAALEAARPFMTSRPALDREAVISDLRGSEVIYDEVTGRWDTPTVEEVERIADAVMALAVPVPTREQIAEAIQRVYGGSLDVRKGSGAQQAADAVLALLNGTTNQPEETA